MNTHFRPRPIDIGLPLQIITDPDEIEEIEKELSHHSFTPIVGRKVLREEDENYEKPVTDDSDKVPIPPVRKVEEDKGKKATFKRNKDQYIQYDVNDKDWDNVVEYDVDSEDEEFLWALSAKEQSNSKKKKTTEPLTEDQLESLLDVFEKKACSKGLTVEESELFRNPFASDLEPCCICGDLEESGGENQLLYCDDCHILVHQFCYGVSKAPQEGEHWRCRKCESVYSA